MQLHEMNGNGVYLYLGIERDSTANALKFKIHNNQQDITSNYGETQNPVTLGSWFTAVFYLQATTSGAAALWINNQQVYSGTGNYAPTDGNQGPFFDTGIYQSYNCTSQLRNIRRNDLRLNPHRSNTLKKFQPIRNDKTKQQSQSSTLKPLKSLHS